MYRRITPNQSPLKAMGLGVADMLENWLTNIKPIETGYSITKSKDGSGLIINVQGDVVLEEFEIVNMPKIKGVIGIEFNNISGSLTKLYDLTPYEIYERIRKFYLNLHQACLGKSSEEQEAILFSKISKGSQPFFQLKSGVIINSMQYVQSLPAVPTNVHLKDLTIQVLSGCLEYSFFARDDFSVEMVQYAKMLSKQLAFYDHLTDLISLFPGLMSNTSEIELLRQMFLSAEYYYEKNLKRLIKKQIIPIGRFTETVEIKYLLICEASPSSGEYFYKSTDNILFKQVWKAFFSTKICGDSNEAYQCLANLGFLLIDSLPYSMPYTSTQRELPEYDKLIKSCLDWWLKKLNDQFKFSPDLKIAFGFKRNSLSIIKGSGGFLKLKGNSYPLSSMQIAAGGSGFFPTTTNLENVFQITSKQKCQCI